MMIYRSVDNVPPMRPIQTILIQPLFYLQGHRKRWTEFETAIT